MHIHEINTKSITMVRKVFLLCAVVLIFQELAFGQWYNFNSKSSNEDFRELYGIPFNESVASRSYMYYLGVDFMDRKASLFIQLDSIKVNSLGYKFSDISSMPILEATLSVDNNIIEQFGFATDSTISQSDSLFLYEKNWDLTDRIVSHVYQAFRDSLIHQAVEVYFKD